MGERVRASLVQNPARGVRTFFSVGDFKIGILFMAPVLFLAIGLYGFPIFDLIKTSFLEIQRGESLFVGFANYQRVVDMPLFHQAVVNSFIWTGFSLLIQLTLPLVLAMLLNQRFRGNTLARVLMLVPWLTPVVVVAIMARWILEPNVGVLNQLLRGGGLITGFVDLLGNPRTALPTLVVVNSWKFLPFGTLLILAGLQTIPLEVLEAARVDGAGAWSRFRYIVFPLLGPVIGFVFFLAFVWNFNTLGLIWLTTKGGPLNKTMTIPVLIYRKAFRGFAMGEAAAMGALAAATLVAVGVVYFRFVWRRRSW